MNILLIIVSVAIAIGSSTTVYDWITNGFKWHYIPILIAYIALCISLNILK